MKNKNWDWLPRRGVDWRAWWPYLEEFNQSLKIKTMQTATLKARRAYLSAGEETKNVLREIFGETALTQPPMDFVKTFDDACALTGENPQDEKFTTGPADEVAYRKLKVINQALNDGWQPDWNNERQQKYYPWFYMGSGGAGFRLDGVYVYGRSIVGSRLCFHSKELSNYAATQFADIYKEYFTL